MKSAWLPVSSAIVGKYPCPDLFRLKLIMHNRPRYEGLSRQLVLAFDIGATFSGISYCVLDPGEIPQVLSVTRFPAQEHLGGNFKIPSLIYYNKRGKATAVGAEALLDSNKEKADKEDWLKLQWWKLLLAPKELRNGVDQLTPKSLPCNKTIIDVFADFLDYLFHCAKEYIIDSHAGGKLLWGTVENRIEFVLSHPNGWEGAQQALMRRAAVRAGLVVDTDKEHERIRFVTEGEASFNYCATNSVSIDAFQKGRNILVVDAGGGTIDISSYVVNSASPLSVEELFSPKCLMQGSEFVTSRARSFIQKILQGSHYDTPEYLDDIVESFDASVKRLFKDPEESNYVKFGSHLDKDIVRGIYGGKLKLSGAATAAFFEDCIETVVDAISGHFRDMIHANTNAFLVGGFAASPWLFNRLQAEFQRLGIPLSRPHGHTNKAVADGAISYYIDNFVTSRVSKYTYGGPCSIYFNSFDLEHQKRSHSVFEFCSGRKMLPGAFTCILYKGSKISTLQEFSQPLVQESYSPLDTVSFTVTSYRGRNESPRWMDMEPPMFTTLCHVEADVSRVPKIPRYNPKGDCYYEQTFRVILLFGLTEFKAQLSWLENGQEKRSPTRVVYEDD